MGEREEGRWLRGVEGSYRRSWGYWGEKIGVDVSAVFFHLTARRKFLSKNQFSLSEYIPASTAQPSLYSKTKVQFHFEKKIFF